MHPTRRKVLSASERRQKSELKAVKSEKVKQDLRTSLSIAWSGQGWIPDDIRNCPPSSFVGTTDVTILRGIWKVTLKAVTMKISLPSLWQPGGILRESYSESAAIWRKTINQAAKEGWCHRAPRLESNQSTACTDQTHLADIVTASDQDKPRDASDTKDQPMEDRSTADSQEKSAHDSPKEAPICIWDFIDGSSIEELEEQVQELKAEAEHATTGILRANELSYNIREKIAAFSDAQARVTSLLDNQLQHPETSTPDMAEHVKFLEEVSQQRRLSLDKELAEVLNEERDSTRDLRKILGKQTLVGHILNYKVSIERSDV